MFPGSNQGRTYNNYQGQQGYNQQGYNNYGPPQGPPPGQYGAPPGPPPGQWGPPSGPPPRNYQQGGGNLNSPDFYQQQQQYQQAQSRMHEQMGNFTRQHGGQSFEGNNGAISGPPPSAPQSFGHNSNMTFQYSNCSGKRKALLIGINYYGTKNELRGCINDVKNMSRFLNEYFGYSYDDMVILTDDQRELARIPTRENIIRAMQWLVKDARPNDSYFFHISSHGGLVPDENGDEEDGFDSCIYPLDFERAGPLVDDTMHDLMVKPLPQGCRLTALFDCCHSGTALDLPFVYSTKGVVKEPNVWKDAGTGAFKAFMDYERGDIGGAISAVSGIFKKVTNARSVNRDAIIQSKMSAADVISMSGCKDDQTSADAKEAGQNTGAMSWAFISVLKQSNNHSYLSLLNEMRNLLSAKYSQKPQLSCSHPQDMNLRFIM
ncbi:Ca(2+)-dependent cysteine protease [Candidozyma auris]|uniref:Metacaspase-1 n=2 Tax=Candidozyma auris TaxID=498019 RepID=A0A2H0ZPG0_CANAR|nr:Ca(2+)-dependent cysteine protease MCA1 [[Candida] auris]KND95588.2 hypothetical protein QG37_08127 [[Candida] auris]PIS52495.1 hypothetical protein CJI97_002140 [[Candida] auris]PIS54811.1 hypothetical protein B9J08_001955 [[Candida] auris]PSK75174.1 hypothetical protein CJJ07_005046 [[Candida] auris]QEL60912.1 hypothetical protein CJJ09_003043 [[Candida] auris]